MSFLRYKIFFLFLLFIMVGGAIMPFSARAIIYQPGDTLNPTCLPTDTNCGVAAPLTVSSLAASTTSAFSLGSSAAPTGTLLYVAGTSTLQNIIPAGNLQYSIGSPESRLQNVYTNNLILGSASFVMEDVNGVLRFRDVNSVIPGLVIDPASGATINGNVFINGGATFTNATTTGSHSIGALVLGGQSFQNLVGVGLKIASSTLALDNSGDWTGTFDGQEASYFLANSFSTSSANSWLSGKTTNNLTEGSNLYYTDTRARNAFSVSAPLSYNTSTGVFSLTTGNITAPSNPEIMITGGAGAVIGSGVNIAIPEAGVATRGLVSTTTQTFVGAKTFSDNMSIGGALAVSGISTLATTTVASLSLSPMTQGSLLFAGAGGLMSQNNSNLFWDNTNSRLGIGTTTPVVKLEVAQNEAIKMGDGFFSSGGDFLNISTNNWFNGTVWSSNYENRQGSTLQLTAGDAVFFSSTAGIGVPTFTERMTIKGSGPLAGNVGIGDTSPAAMLTVGNGDLFQVNSSGNIVNLGGAAHSVSNSLGALVIDSAGAGALNIGTGANGKTITLGNTTGATGLAFNSGSGNINFDNNTFYIDVASNRVGIGMNAPAAALEIVGPNNSAGFKFSTGDMGAVTDPFLISGTDLGSASSNLFKMEMTNNTTGSNNQTIASIINNDGSGITESLLELQTLDSDTTGDFLVMKDPAGAAKFVFKLNGNFGIGTSTPSTSLHVVGDALVNSQASAVGAAATQRGLQITAGSLGANDGTIRGIDISATVAGTTNIGDELTGLHVETGAIDSNGTTRGLHIYQPSTVSAYTSVVKDLLTLERQGGTLTNALQYIDGGTTKFFVSSSGDVGIGSGISNDAKLEVVNNLSSTKGLRIVGVSGQADDYLLIEANGGNNIFSIDQYGTIDLKPTSNAGAILVDGGNVTSGGLLDLKSYDRQNSAVNRGILSVRGNATTLTGALTGQSIDMTAVNTGTSNTQQGILVLMNNAGSGQSIGVDIQGTASGTNLVDTALKISNAQTAIDFSDATSNINVAGTLNFDTNTFFVDATNNRVGIGTTTPDLRFHVNNTGQTGAVARFTDDNGSCDIDPTSTALVCASDVSLKKNILTLDNSLEKVLALNPVLFNWNKEENGAAKHFGFVAQEVEQIFPELVSENEQGVKSLAYSNFAPILTKAIKEIVSLADGFKRTLVMWFADAANGIGDFFANRVRTREICIGDAQTGETCITKNQLDALLYTSTQAQTNANDTRVNTDIAESEEFATEQAISNDPSFSKAMEGEQNSNTQTDTTVTEDTKITTEIATTTPVESLAEVEPLQVEELVELVEIAEELSVESAGEFVEEVVREEIMEAPLE